MAVTMIKAEQGRGLYHGIMHYIDETS